MHGCTEGERLRSELETALAAAKSLDPGQLRQFLAELRLVELEALLRLSTPALPTPEPVDAEDLLDVTAAAKHIHMSEKWVYANLDVLPCLRIGNGRKPRIRFRRRDLDAWLQEHAIEHRRH